MKVCCVELGLAVRLIGLYGLVVGAVIMVEMSAEMGRVRCSIESKIREINGEDVFVRAQEISGGAAVSAWLLGLRLDEFGSRMRHSMHTREMPPHVHVTHQEPSHVHVHNEPPLMEAPKRNQTQDLSDLSAENQIYIGFLMFAIVYSSASALLVFGSIPEIRWTSVPWLVAHLGAVSAQMAGLVAQVTAAVTTAPMDDHLAPGHPDEAHVHDDDHRGSAAPGALILSVLNMIFLVYIWVVVIVTMKSWMKSTNLTMSTRPAPGDESFALSPMESSTYSSYY